ncbi:hypothetical protein [Salirhabdus salicampi]|uniref:hypothetical protein n=1 Tax=Salirhabdus salicampi TaxID=476102 RepID=UPI0020C2B250|nr:hypothetical protein [Salirhabdus salicampi]MCP8615807.1 hypothetical protein [Salirhabdus salicampi]
MNETKMTVRVLKDIIAGKEPKAYHYDLNIQSFGELVNEAMGRGLLVNGIVSRSRFGNHIQYVLLNEAEVTKVGEEYISDNTFFKRLIRKMNLLRLLSGSRDVNS